MTWTSQRPGRAVSVGRSSKRSFHDSLIGLRRKAPLEGCRAAGHWD